MPGELLSMLCRCGPRSGHRPQPLSCRREEYKRRLTFKGLQALARS
jgi:hypothetical protein